jgi:hypothetical protein
MKPAFIKYQNFGTNLAGKFNIYSDKGYAVPSGVSKQELFDGVLINVDSEASKIFVVPKIYDLVASGVLTPEISTLNFYKTDKFINDFPIYNDENNNLSLFRWFRPIPALTYLVIGDLSLTGYTLNELSDYSGTAFFKQDLIFTGFYRSRISPSWDPTGVNVTLRENKLHVYNNPGVSNFAGKYHSGIFQIGGFDLEGYQNINNQDFYIAKFGQEWRAIQNNNPNMGQFFTWYTNLNFSQYPSVTGWLLGGGDKPPNISTRFNPPPEMNFGLCPANSLVLPIYVYESFSSDPEFNRLKFYSGGMLNDSGMSELFSENIGLSDMFPDLYDTFFDKNFYYTNIVNNNRLFLFRTIQNDFFTKFYITKLPQDFNSGFYYWGARNDIFFNTGINTLQQARKVYLPLGNNTDNLKNISININPTYLNRFFNEDINFNLNNFTGNEFLYITNNTLNNDPLSVQGVYQNIKIGSGLYSGLNCISGDNYIFASPKFDISGVTCGNLPFSTLNPSSASIFNGSGRVQFVKATEGFRYEVQFTRNLLSGWNPTGVTLIESASQSNVPSGFIRKEFYFPLSDLGGGNLFFRMVGTPAVWKILDSEYNFLDIRNCYTQSNILPSEYWFTGEWSSNINQYSKFGFTELYPHNRNAFLIGQYLLYENTDYDFSKISGIFNLNTGESFVFDLEDDQKITGKFLLKNNIYEYRGIINENNKNGYWAFNSGDISSIYISLNSKKLVYDIYRSGVNIILSKYFDPLPTTCFK